MWVIMTFSQAGRVAATPLKSKAQTNFAAKEVMTFCQHLGHHKVAFYGDNEPTIRSILRMLLSSRHVLGLRTTILTPRIRDSAGNSLAENAVQRERGLTCTVMGDLMSRNQVRLNSNNPLWSWAAKHSCWIMSGYQAYHGVTAIELVHGKQYAGSIVPFGCPAYAYVRSQALNPPKGDPKWKMTFSLARLMDKMLGLYQMVKRSC